MRKHVYLVILVFIVILAFFLRFHKINKSPPSLNWDETAIAYNAYSILKTGKDEWGVPFPLNFKSFGEYKLPAQIYASIPGVAVFGLTELGVRITPVIYGTLTVLLLYFLANLLFKDKRIGLLSAFLLSVSPWHIQLTRASLESSFSVFWVVLGAILFIKGFEKKKYWIFSIIPFVISIYTYNAARVFVPLFIFVLFLIYRRELLKDLKIFLISFGLFIGCLIPIGLSFFSGEASARFKLVSIMDDPGFVQRVNKARGATNLPSPLPRLIHNKATHFAYVFTGNYLSHFTPSFLFIEGAGHKQHHVQGIGELYYFQAPFILIGLYFLFKKKKKWRFFITTWLLLVFIPVSITVDSIPNALRTILAVVPYSLLTAYGFWKVIDIFKGKKKGRLIYISIILISLGLFFYQFINFQNNLYNTYPKLYSRDWQYGYKEAVNYVKDHYDEYDLIVFSRTYGEPHMFTLFFMNWDPINYQTNSNLNRFEAYDWVWVLGFDKFYFPNLSDEKTKYSDVIRENEYKKILFIGKPSDFPDSIKRLYTIDFLNGDRAFDIVEKR